MIGLMHDVSPKVLAKRFMAASIVGAVIVVSGCQTAPTARPEAAPAPPSLQLIESKPLVLADDCAASGSVFVEFTVLNNGHTSRVQPSPAPACVQQALTAWIDSFRYTPPAAATATGIEWMLVTARKGS